VPDVPARPMGFVETVMSENDEKDGDPGSAIHRFPPAVSSSVNYESDRRFLRR